MYPHPDFQSVHPPTGLRDHRIVHGRWQHAAAARRKALRYGVGPQPHKAPPFQAASLHMRGYCPFSHRRYPWKAVHFQRHSDASAG